MADLRGLDSLANLVSGQAELEFSNTSGSTDEIRTPAYHGPSPDAVGRVLNMQMGITEKNAMPQMGNPGGYIPPAAPRSASPSSRENPYAMENQPMRASSPASRIARPPCLSQEAEDAMQRPDRRASSAGSGGPRRSQNGRPDVQLELRPQPLTDTLLQAPPTRRSFILPPSNPMRERSVASPGAEAQFRNAVMDEGERRDPTGCIAPEAILAPATRDPGDCVAAKIRSGNTTPSEVMVQPEGSDGDSRGSGHALQQDVPAVRPASLPAALAVPIDGGKPPTPPHTPAKTFLVRTEECYTRRRNDTHVRSNQGP